MFDVLEQAYVDAAALVAGLDEPSSWRPSGCAGWAVRDLVFHMLSDAQRALVAIATPDPGPADRNFFTYWQTAPGQDDPQSRGLRALRTMASAWTWDFLQTTFAETTQAVITASARTNPEDLLATQGHVLRADDLFATLAVEASVHYLDMAFDLPAPAPSTVCMALARRTVDALLGRPTPPDWDDVSWVRLATGRAAATPEQLNFLGVDRHRLPLLS